MFCFATQIKSQFKFDENAIKVYDANSGLPNNTIQNSFQDSLGFIWISTAEALVRFDGRNFVSYYPNAQDSNCVSGNNWFSFAQTNKSEIWLVHNKGISIYSQATNQFKNILKVDGAFDNKNCFLGIDKNGYLWAFVISKGLVKINTQTQKIESILKIPIEEFYYPNYYSVPSGILFNNKIYFSVLQRSYYYDLEKANFHLIFSDSLDIRCWMPINKKDLLIGGTNVLMKGNEAHFENLKQVVKNEFNTNSISINDIKVISDSTAFIAGKNLFLKISTKNWVMNQGIRVVDIYKKLMPFLITKVMIDDFGNFWLCTNGSGLIKVPYNHKQINSLPLLENGNLVKAIRANNDYVVTGYFANAMSIFNRRSKTLDKLDLKIFDDKIHSFETSVYTVELLDSCNVFASAAYFANSGIYNLKTKKWISLRNEILKCVTYNSKENQIYKFAIKLKKNVVLFNQGQSIFTCELIKSKPVVALYSVIEHEAITTAFQDKDSSLWIGTMNNLYFAKAKTKKFLKIQLPGEQTIKSITQNKKGEYWIASVNGIFVLNKNHQVIIHYTRQNGLLNDYVYSVMCDAEDNIWFSSNKGITRYNSNTKAFKNFLVEDGLQGNEFNTNAYYQAENGELFFGGSNGVNYFYPKQLQDNLKEAKCNISEMKLDDKSFQPDSSIWFKKHLQLNFDQNTLSFSFCSEDHKQPERTEFAYYLEGYEKDWIQNKNNNFVRYPNLPSGQYILKYKCTNGDGIWSTSFSQLVITIFPPWYETTWAIFLFVLIGISILVLVFYIVIKSRDEKQKRKLEELKRIQDERNRISRDLHDNVGSMVSFVSSKIDWVIKNTALSKNTNEDLKQIKSNAGEIMSGLRETIWTLSNSNLTNASLADKLKTYVKSHLLVKYVIEDSIVEETSINNETVLNIYRCCQEIVNNINKHSQANLVKINISSDQKCKFSIRFFDNGVGISQNDFEKNDHHGLKNLKSRLNEVGALLQITSEIGKGTLIEIVLN